MRYGLNIRQDGELDLVSLGALVHRLDPGIILFRKATQCQIHVSGGEFNVAANVSDCFGLRAGIMTAMVDYPIGDLVSERVKAMGIPPFYRRFKHNGVTGPNIAAVYGDRGFGVRPPCRLIQPFERGCRATKAGSGLLRREAQRASSVDVPSEEERKDDGRQTAVTAASLFPPGNP